MKQKPIDSVDSSSWNTKHHVHCLSNMASDILHDIVWHIITWCTIQLNIFQLVHCLILDLWFRKKFYFTLTCLQREESRKWNFVWTFKIFAEPISFILQAQMSKNSVPEWPKSRKTFFFFKCNLRYLIFDHNFLHYFTIIFS